MFFPLSLCAHSPMNVRTHTQSHMHTLPISHTHAPIVHAHSYHGVLNQQRHSGCSDPQTNLNLSLTTAHVNADVTLMDRLQPLLRASLHSQHSSLRSGGTLGQTMKHSLYMTNSNYHMVNLVSLIDSLYSYVHVVIEIDSYVLRNGCK